MPLNRKAGLNRKSPMKRKPWENKEVSDAIDFGGKGVKGSGNKWWNPGDVKSGEFLIDSKTTIHKSYSIKETTWLKIQKESLHSQRLPALSIQTSSESGDGIEVVVLNKQDLLAMLDELKELRAKE
jgi:hypothetical protein